MVPKICFYDSDSMRVSLGCVLMNGDIGVDMDIDYDNLNQAAVLKLLAWLESLDLEALHQAQLDKLKYIPYSKISDVPTFETLVREHTELVANWREVYEMMLDYPSAYIFYG